MKRSRKREVGGGATLPDPPDRRNDMGYVQMRISSKNTKPVKINVIL